MASTVPFGLDPTTFATLVALGILLATRLIDALLPKGRSFKFTQSWFVNGEKVKENTQEYDGDKRQRREGGDDDE